MNYYINKLIFMFTVLYVSCASAAFDGGYIFQLESATQATIDAIPTPKIGSMIYNTNDNKIYYYNGSSWNSVVSSNIYSTNAQIANNREVDLNTHTMSFINGNVGIGDSTPDATLDVAGSFRLDGIYYDKDGDTGTAGQVLSSTVTGTDWVDVNLKPVPYISNSVINASISSTKVIILTGYNFISTSTVTIPGFDGSINSINVISPSEIQLNITTGVVNNFDLIVSNNGIMNTQWLNNGVSLLHVSNANGQSQATAGETCKNILDNGYSVGDGIYWINPDGGSTANAFQVYCDMTTDSGGWNRVVRTTGNNHEFGQKTHNYTYAVVTDNIGIYETYNKIKNFSKIMIKKVGTVDYASYDLVSVVSGESIYDLMTFTKNQAVHVKDDTAFDGARVKGLTSEYSGTKVSGTLNYDYFFMSGINESADNDQAYMSFSDSTGSTNTWADTWRGNNQAGTLWSLLNGDYYSNTNYHIGNNYSQAGAGYKGGNNGTYEIYIK